MSQSWFYVVGKKQIGPVTSEQLRAATAAGTINADTRVRPATAKAWYRASQVPGLMPTAAATAEEEEAETEPAADVASSPVSRPSGARSISSPLRKRRKSSVGPAIVAFGGLAIGGIAAAAVWYVTANSPPAPEPAAVAKATTPAPAKQPTKAADTPAKPAEKKEKPAEEMASVEADRWPSMDGTENAGRGGKSARRSLSNAGWSAAESALSLDETARGAALYQDSAQLAPANKIDEIVFARLKTLKITPASLSSDGVFLRRVYLDVIGTLPTVEEARAFLADKDPNKRRALIDALLQRREYTEYWAMRWSDILRIKAEFPINLWPNAAQAYHRWIRAAFKANMPYDQFVREMLTACGSNFRVGQVNFYRALQSKKPLPIAKAVALTFMGERTDNWPKGRLEGMAAFFSMIGYKNTSEWKEEIVLFDPDKAKLFVAGAAAPAKDAPTKPAPKAASAKPAPAKAADAGPAEQVTIRGLFPDGTDKNWVELTADRDPREVFADWLINAKNPQFCRPIVNRLWAALLGRGIVQEVDDFRPDNPPQNPQLLDYLAQELAASHFDLKQVLRLILNSKTYQLSCVPQAKEPASADNFGHYAMHQLEAEILIDAICQITGTTEEYSSAIPEPYTWVPEFNRTISLPDGSITSSFLELFGRPPRDSGMEAERNSRTTAAQRLHMLNSTHIRKKITTGPKLQALLKTTEGDTRATVDNLYLAILSRYPSDEERRTVSGYYVKDIAWALINTMEFYYRH